ncbi:hypothetical protein EYF80_029348 [Liparis tanakae]|uniref:Uncharacterized protein n=1 Tax=Liparis tanakae TaxID=230148 RepID=A0A4Z2H3Q5_9TELE|nr:hypothetical protein EYF80_029348 [Liparis tanakae]
MFRLKGRLSSTAYRSEEKRFRTRPIGVVSKKETVAWGGGAKRKALSAVKTVLAAATEPYTAR